MKAFYVLLNELKLRVKYDRNERKKTYTLVGKDLDKAKELYNTHIRGIIPIPSIRN